MSGLGLLHLLLLIWVLGSAALAPTHNAHDAVVTVALIYHLIHSGVAVVMSVLQALRVRKNYVGNHAAYEPAVIDKWWIFTCVTFWLTFLSIILLPKVWGVN